MVKRFVLVAVFSISALCTANAGNLTGSEIEKVFIGKTSFQAKEGSGTAVYRRDGTMTVVYNGKTLDGKWRINGNSICTHWSFNKEEKCFTVEAIGKNKWRMSHGTIITRR